jgi:cytochrome c556
MKHVVSFRKGILLPLVVVALLGAAAGVAQAQVKKGKSRPMATAQFMKQVVKPQCEALKKGLDGGPASAEAWATLAAQAAVLNEASYLLMDDGRCPDGVWAEAASKVLRQGSADVLSAAESKDLAAAKDAFGRMTKACGACHDKHKEKK